MKILLVCNAGMSTSILENNINTYAKENKEDIECIAVPISQARSIFSNYDLILLGPQVKFLLADVKRMAGSIPVDSIPGPIFALGKAKEAIDYAKKIVAENGGQ